MKKFSEFLAEEEKKTKGTYASVRVSQESNKKLYDWLKEQKIKDLLENNIYHCTIIYSRKLVEKVSDLNPKLPFVAKIIGWKVMGDENNLCLLLKSSKLTTLYKQAIAAGAVSDFLSFIPHISISSNYTGELPSELPNMKIEFDRFVVKEQEMGFKYSDN